MGQEDQSRNNENSVATEANASCDDVSNVNPASVEPINPVNVSSRRNISLWKIVPSTITITGFCFGLTAINLALFRKWEHAVLCIFIAAILDAFDGMAARFLGQSSKFGAELDSLSDLVCFGVAPGLLIFLKILNHLDNFGWACCLFFTICCALRLARFNTAAFDNEKIEPQPEWTKGYFTGTPSPAGAIIALLPFILFFSTNYSCFLDEYFAAFCILSAGILMVSRVKNFSSKMIKISKGYTPIAILCATLIIICLITEVWMTILILVSSYVVLIPYAAYLYSEKERQMQQNQ